jgi:hypothetical protein
VIRNKFHTEGPQILGAIASRTTWQSQFVHPLRYISIFHTHLHLHAPLIRRTTGRSFGTLKKNQRSLGNRASIPVTLFPVHVQDFQLPCPHFDGKASDRVTPCCSRHLQSTRHCSWSCLYMPPAPTSKHCFCPHSALTCTRITFTTNGDYFPGTRSPSQCKICLLRGTNRMFKCNWGYYLSLKGLNTKLKELTQNSYKYYKVKVRNVIPVCDEARILKTYNGMGVSLHAFYISELDWR